MQTGANELRRAFGLSTATYVVIASMVGTGILVSPGYMMVALNNHAAIFGLWIVGGMLAICGALCVAELAAALPQAGGEYVYLREAYGPMPAFLAGWTSFILGFAAPLAVAGYVAATYLLAPFTGSGTEAQSTWIVQAVAATIILAVTIPNLFGHRQSAQTQNATTLLKLGLFVSFVILGLFSGNGQFGHVSAGRPIREVELGAMATQLFYVMFAYSGWNAASYVAGEVKDPGRTLPRALILGTGVVTLLYVLLNVVFAYAVPLAEVGIADAEQVPLMAAQKLLGASASAGFSIAVGLTFLATVSAFVVTGPRIYYAMARDGLFPAAAGRLSPKGGVPVWAMLAQSLCAIVILFTTDFQNLYKYASVGLSLFTLLFISAVYVLRHRRPELSRPFRVPGYPVVPLIYMAVTVFMTVFAFIQWRGPSLFSLATILAGVPAYYAWVATRPRVR